MPALSPCPNRDRLQALKRGDLEGDSLEAICQHLCDCAQCDQALAALEEFDDEIVGNLRHFYHREPLIKREECDRLEARAQAILSPPFAANDDPPTTPLEHAIPKRLGKYHLGHKLGQGGMGVVFAATHIHLHREVAIKVISPEYAENPRVLARFRRETKAVGKLKHDNIVTATDAGEAEGHHFLVMELVDGLDLDTLLKVNGPLPVADACEIIRQAALGMQYVHEQQIIHRDLKPSNLMLSSEGMLKILDLGLARIFTDRIAGDELTRNSQVMGTDDYMAPEQWENSGSVDIRADIYALGCTLYKILTGQVLWGGQEYKPLPKKKAAHRLLEPPSVQSHRPEVSPGLARVLEKTLEKDRNARFATPGELAEALTPFANGNDCKLLIAKGKQQAAGVASGAHGTPGTKPETVVSPQPVATPRQSKARRFIAVMGRKKWPAVLGVLAAASAVAGVMVFTGRDKGSDGTAKEPNAKTELRKEAGRPQWPEVDPSLPKVDANLELLLEVPDNQPLRAGRRTTFLTQTPAPLYWKNESFGHFVLPFPEKQEVFAHVPFVGLLALGRAEYAAYHFQLGINQVPWTGGAGLFFGYHESTYKGKRCFRYQFLEIKPFKGEFVVVRNTRMQFPDHDDTAFTDSFANAKVGKLLSGREYLLAIKVRGKELLEVTWNGTPLPDLVKSEHNAGGATIRLTESDYFGQFGTFSRKSSTMYGSAWIMLHERGFP